MKKLLVISLIAMSLCACGTQNKESATDNSQKEEVIINNNNTETSEKDDTTSVLENYQSPDALSNNFKDYIFYLDNKLYSLPVPVSEFIRDGWIIKYAPDTLPANYIHSQGITLKKNEIELNFKVKNFSDDEISTKEAIVIGMNMGDDTYQKHKNYESIDFKLSGGITFGMSFSDFCNSVDISMFSVEDSIFKGAIDYSYFEPSNRIYVTFYNDKLVGLSFEKNKFN